MVPSTLEDGQVFRFGSEFADDESKLLLTMFNEFHFDCVEALPLGSGMDD